MNTIKFVPANPMHRMPHRRIVETVRLSAHGSIMSVINEMEQKGWVRLKYLKPAEKRLYRAR